MALTFLATLFIPLQYAVLLGVAFSVVMHVARQSNKVVITQWIPTPGGFPLEEPRRVKHPAIVLRCCRYTAAFSSPRPRAWRRCCPDLDNTDRAVVALVLRGRTEIGSTFVTVLRRYAEALHARNSKLMLVGIDPAVRDQLAKTGLLAVIGEENVFLATPRLGEAMNQAIAAANVWLGQASAGEVSE